MMRQYKLAIRVLWKIVLIQDLRRLGLALLESFQLLFRGLLVHVRLLLLLQYCHLVFQIRDADHDSCSIFTVQVAARQPN